MAGRRQPAAPPGRLQRRRLAGRFSRAAAGTSSCRASSRSSEHGEPVAAAYAQLPEIRRRTSTTGRHARPWSSASASASPLRTRTPTPPAPSAACSTYPPRTDATTCTSPTASGSPTGSPEDRRPRAAEEERSSASARRTPSASQDDPEKEARRERRQRDYEARVAGRARNLDLGAALAPLAASRHRRGQAARLARTAPLRQGGAWAHRLCVEQPTTTNKQGKVTVRYPRGAQAEKELHGEATERPSRARTPEDALAVVLRLLVAQRLVETDGLGDRQGVYEPQSAAIDGARQARRARRLLSVKQHLAEQEAERERREQAWREQASAKLAEQRQARRRRTRPLRLLLRADQVTRRRGREARQPRPPRRLRAAVGQRSRRGGGRLMRRPPELVTSIARET